MPAKGQLDANLWFLYICLQNSDYKVVDFQAVSRATDVTPHAARMRFSRLKKQIEKNTDEPRTDIPAKPARPQIQKKTTSKSGTTQKSAAPSVKNSSLAQTVGQGKSIMMEEESRRVQPGTAACPHVKKHIVFIDLTQESDCENDMRGEDNSDEDLPLMKKRRTAESLGLSGPILDDVPLVVSGHGHQSDSLSNLSSMASVSQSNNRSVSGKCAEAASRYNFPTHEPLRTAQSDPVDSATRDVNVPGPTDVDLTNDSPVPSDALPQQMSGFQNSGFIVPQDQGMNRTTFQPNFNFENGALLFGDGSYDSFLGTHFDLQTAYGCHPTVPRPFSSQVSSPLPPVSQRTMSMSVDERPAYSQALRVLDHPELEAAHNAHEMPDLASMQQSE